MIAGAAGAELEAIAEGFVTGLAGTLGVTIDDNHGTDIVPRTTAGIVEIQTVGANGIYSYVGTFPPTPGVYSITWDDGTNFATEEIYVSGEFAPSPGLSPVALCTDEDVRKYLGIKDGELSAEDREVIVRLVNAASETFTDESQRLWKDDPTFLGQPRLYRLDAFDISVGRLRIDDCAQVNQVAVGEYRNLGGPSPLGTDSWGTWEDEPGHPISAIIFSEALTLWPGNVVEVEAVWGWPRVPEKVRQAVIYTASEWYARDVENFSQTFSIDQGRILMPQVLPAQVQREAESYRRWRVA